MYLKAFFYFLQEEMTTEAAFVVFNGSLKSTQPAKCTIVEGTVDYYSFIVVVSIMQ